MPPKNTLILFLLLLSNFFYAQQTKFEAPDYETIKKEIGDKQSIYYYPKLLKRFTQNDTLLTIEDYRHVYFGYTYQRAYDPYKVSPDNDKFRKYYYSIESNEYGEFIKLANKALKENPFDLRVMNFLGYVYHLKGDEVMSKKVSKSFKGIINAISTSGDGLKCETGFHVISVSDEYVVLHLFGLESKSQASAGSCDYFQFEKGKYSVNGLYFNITQMQAKVLGVLGEE